MGVIMAQPHAHFFVLVPPGTHEKTYAETLRSALQADIATLDASVTFEPTGLGAIKLIVSGGNWRETTHAHTRLFNLLPRQGYEVQELAPKKPLNTDPLDAEEVRAAIANGLPPMRPRPAPPKGRQRPTASVDLGWGQKLTAPRAAVLRAFVAMNNVGWTIVHITHVTGQPKSTVEVAVRFGKIRGYLTMTKWRGHPATYTLSTRGRELAEKYIAAYDAKEAKP